VNGSPRDFGDVVLSLWPDVVWLLAVLCAALAGIWCLAAALRIARGGRGGIPGRERLRRAVGDADRENLPVTKAMDLGGLVISREGERLLQARAAALTPDALTQPIDPDPALGCPRCTGAPGCQLDCLCKRPCGYAYCQAIDPADGCTWCRPGTLHAWPCTCGRSCGSAACLPAVRHG
jgi:hypothetical protein